MVLNRTIKIMNYLCIKVSERGRHLFETGIWSDCEFIVGLPPNIKVRTDSSTKLSGAHTALNY